MYTTHTIRVDELVEGDRLKNDHVVFSLTPSVTQPGKIAVGAGYDGHVYVKVLAPDAEINVMRRGPKATR